MSITNTNTTEVDQTENGHVSIADEDTVSPELGALDSDGEGSRPGRETGMDRTVSEDWSVQWTANDIEPVIQTEAFWQGLLSPQPVAAVRVTHKDMPQKDDGSARPAPQSLALNGARNTYVESPVELVLGAPP